MAIWDFGLGLLAGLGCAGILAERVWRAHRRAAARHALGGVLAERQQVREIEEERDRLFNLSLDLLAVSDLDGRLLQVNPAWVRTLQWSRDEIMAQSFAELVHPEDRPAAERALADLGAGTAVRDLELRMRCRDGSYRWIAWSSSPLMSRARFFTAARDITERKHAEAELQRYQQRLQRLASQLATVEERQNRRLAEILHDTLAQELFAAQAKLSLLRHPERIADPQTILDDVGAILDHANELTRSLTFELFPPALYEVGLDAALEWLCRSFTKTRGLHCEFEGEGELPELEADLRTLFYQGARELLGNAYKHGDARRVEVRLRCGGASIELQVDDDGRGFAEAGSADREPSPCARSAAAGDDQDPLAGGFGLFNLRERLGQKGGCLLVERSHLGGGRVTITVPKAAAEV